MAERKNDNSNCKWKAWTQEEDWTLWSVEQHVAFQRTDVQTPSERASRGLAEGELGHVFQGRELRLTVVLF